MQSTPQRSPSTLSLPLGQTWVTFGTTLPPCGPIAPPWYYPPVITLWAYSINPHPLCWLLAAARWSGGTEPDITRAHGMYANFVENTFCQYENQIVDLITKHSVKRVFFTGHSLGGGLANVAHLAVRGQLALGQADLLGSGSPWTNPKLAEDQVEWLACTFAAPATMVRPPAGTPQALIKVLDGSSYNIVYGCDAVPRGLGMLTYLDGLLKTVLPEVPKALKTLKALKGLKTENEVLNVLPLFGILLNTIGKNDDDDDDGVTELVKTLKNSGVTTVMRQFTHTGTVVYKKGRLFSYKYLKGNDIDGTLDQPWTWLDVPLADLEDLNSAHAYYEKFEFGAK